MRPSDRPLLAALRALRLCLLAALTLAASEAPLAAVLDARHAAFERGMLEAAARLEQAGIRCLAPERAAPFDAAPRRADALLRVAAAEAGSCRKLLKDAGFEAPPRDDELRAAGWRRSGFALLLAVLLAALPLPRVRRRVAYLIGSLHRYARRLHAGARNAYVRVLAEHRPPAAGTGLERELALLRTVVEGAGVGLFVADREQRMEFSNAAFRGLLGGADRLDALAAQLAPAAREELAALTEAAYRGRAVRADFELRPPGRWIELALSPAGGGRLQGLAVDISGRKQSERDSERRANTDALTGAGNRHAMNQALAHIERRRRGDRRGFAYMAIDLDRFKEVNDTHGHAAGDAVLRHCAAVLRGAVRRSDLVARVGGDEFAILLESGITPDDAQALARKILAGLAKPVRLGPGCEVEIGASIGIAIHDGAGGHDELIGRADAAMYRAKRLGRNRYEVCRGTIPPADPHTG